MKSNWIIISLIVLTFISCENSDVFIPKPHGYPRKHFPKSEFVNFNDSICPYTFNYPTYFSIKKAEGCHKNIHLNEFNGDINFSYLPVNDTNLFYMIEYIQKRISEHTGVARAINKKYYKNDSTKTYGVFFQLDGEVAMNSIFYLTDSTNHFISGTLHFNVSPNFDSLKQSLDYVNKDLDSLLNSLKWK